MNSLGVNRFLQEIESHCPLSAIATFFGSDGESLVIDDLNRKGDRMTYGNQPAMKKLLIKKLISRTEPIGSLILRSFIPKVHELTQLPIKELRGYSLKYHADELEFEKLSPTLMFACQNTDTETGEPLPLEQSVRYC